MEVRGSGPHHGHALEALCENLVSRSRLSSTVRHTLLPTFVRSDVSADGLGRRDRSSINLARRLQGPSGTRHFVCESNDHKHSRLSCQHLPEPGPCCGAVFVSDGATNNGTQIAGSSCKDSTIAAVAPHTKSRAACSASRLSPVEAFKLSSRRTTMQSRIAHSRA